MNEREDPEGWRRLHPLTPLLRSAQLLYAVVIAVVAARLGGPAVLILVVSAGVVAVWITASYLRFRYQLTDESLILNHGVIIRQRRVIPRSRIQNVDLRAGFLQQILRVVTARVETAGGHGTEAMLHVVGRADGELLRDTLVTTAPGQRVVRPEPGVFLEPDVPGPATADAPARLEPPASTDYLVRRVGLIDLVIAGATSNRAGLLVAALLGGDYFLDVLPTDWLLARVLPPEMLQPEAAANSLVQAAQQDLRAFAIGLLLLMLFFGLAGWGLSILASVIRFFDFTIKQRSSEIRVAYGLFTRREKGFRRSRVQNAQIEEPILRRWLGLASVKVQTAGYGPGVKADERVETLAPIARRADVRQYIKIALPELDWTHVDWRPSHPRARRRLFIRRAAVVTLACGILTALVGPTGIALLFGLIPAWFLAAAHYRHLGHARSGSFVLVREGLWTRRTYIVPVRKIQALHFKQSPFQRRLGLGTLAFETAGNPYEWHSPRSIDLGTDYGLQLMEGLATEVRGTGLTF
jgi:putative membrane protein